MAAPKKDTPETTVGRKAEPDHPIEAPVPVLAKPAPVKPAPAPVTPAPNTEVEVEFDNTPQNEPAADLPSAPHKTSQPGRTQPTCPNPDCNSTSIGMAGGMRTCNQCGRRF